MLCWKGKREALQGKHSSISTVIWRCIASQLDMLTKPRLSAVSEFTQAHARLLPWFLCLQIPLSWQQQPPGSACPWGSNLPCCGRYNPFKPQGETFDCFRSVCSSSRNFLPSPGIMQWVTTAFVTATTLSAACNYVKEKTFTRISQ